MTDRKQVKRGVTIATRSGDGAVIDPGKPLKAKAPVPASQGRVAVPDHPAPDTPPPPHRG